VLFVKRAIASSRSLNLAAPAKSVSGLTRCGATDLVKSLAKWVDERQR